MIALLRAELLKYRSTRSTLWLLLAMIGLVAGVVALHGLNLPSRTLGRAAGQLVVIGQGERMGPLFGALLGAMAITTEFRHGTIRPTLLVSPHRGRVLMSKVVVTMLIGAAFGLIAAATALGAGYAALVSRSLTVVLDQDAVRQLFVGLVLGTALVAGIGVGLGAVVRNQASAMVGICVWLLFVEGLLFGDIGLSDYGRLLPGSLAAAASGLEQTTLLSPTPAVLLLVAYMVAFAAIGSLAMARRDVA